MARIGTLSRARSTRRPAGMHRRFGMALVGLAAMIALSALCAPVAFAETARFDCGVVTPIPDGGTIDVPIVVSGVAVPIKSVTVSLYITHTYDGDLNISLVSPDGTIVDLSSGNGGPLDNYGTAAVDGSRTTFDDSAPLAITSGSAPFVGTFKPETPLSALAGKQGSNVNGTWKLRVQDSSGSDTGDVRAWSLIVNTDDYAAPYTYKVEGDDNVTIVKCDDTASGALVIPATLDGHPVTVLGTQSFKDCTALTSVTIPEGVDIIEPAAFHGDYGLKSVIIPDGVTFIGYNAFMNCTGLTSVAIPDTVTSLGDGAFMLCSGLTSVSLPHGLTDIPDAAFGNCSSLKTIVIPDGYTSIGSYAFPNCTHLASVTIPDGVTDLGSSAFEGCSILESARFRGDAPTIGSETFGQTAPGFTIWVVAGNTTWGTVPGTWNGYPTAIWPTFTVTPVLGVHGTVAAAGATSALAGFDTNFTITPDAGYHTVDVTVDGVSRGAITSYAFKDVEAPHTIAATFAANPVTLGTTTRLSGRSSVKRKKALKLTGIVSPGGPGTVTITMKRKVGKKWKPAGHVHARVVNGAYSCTIKPKYTGSWRMVASYSGGVVGATTYRSSASGTKTVKVK